MSTFGVTALFCMVFAAFVMSATAQEPEEELTLSVLHGEVQQQLAQEDLAGLSGAELAGLINEERGMPPENVEDQALGVLAEMQQLLQEQFVEHRRDELAGLLNEERGIPTEPEEELALSVLHEEVQQQLAQEHLAGLSGAELAGLINEEREVLTEVEREMSEQLRSEHLAARFGKELALMLREDEDLEKRYGSCSVTGFKAECCGGTSFKILWKRINLSACVLAEFLPEDIGIHVAVTVLGKTVLDKTVSVKNPEGLCVAIPEVAGALKLCIKFSDLSVNNGKFHGCVALQPKAMGFSIVTINLGCIDIP